MRAPACASRRDGLDIPHAGLKIPGISGGNRAYGAEPGHMNSNQPLTSPNAYPMSNPMKQPCTHPRVQVVSRDEDSEFVECLECREIFESSEFKDMAIEERATDDMDA